MNSSDVTHSNAAMFGSSYAACFYMASLGHRFKLDFYCGQHSTIYSNLEVDSETGAFKIRKDAGEWALTVFNESSKHNHYTRPSDYSLFIINTFLPLEVPSLFGLRLDVDGGSKLPLLSRSIVRAILLDALECDNQLIQSVRKHKAFIQRLREWNHRAAILILPQPFEIQPDYLAPHPESPVSGQSRYLLSSLLDQVTSVFAELTDLHLLMPPLELMVDGAYTARSYCTLSKDRNWRAALDGASQGISSDESVEDRASTGLPAHFLPPSNRHRNVDYACLYLDRLAEVVASSASYGSMVA